MNGITYDSSGVKDNKNVLMGCSCKKAKGNAGAWLEIYEFGCADPCGSLYMSISDLRSLAAYLDATADELEIYRDLYTEKTRMKLAEGERVLHDYDPNEKHIDEY